MKNYSNFAENSYDEEIIWEQIMNDSIDDPEYAKYTSIKRLVQTHDYSNPQENFVGDLEEDLQNHFTDMQIMA